MVTLRRCKEIIDTSQKTNMSSTSSVSYKKVFSCSNVKRMKKCAATSQKNNHSVVSFSPSKSAVHTTKAECKCNIVTVETACSKQHCLFNFGKRSTRSFHCTAVSCIETLDSNFFDRNLRMVSSSQRSYKRKKRTKPNVVDSLISPSFTDDKHHLDNLCNQNNLSPKSILLSPVKNHCTPKKVLHWADREKHTKDVSAQVVPKSNACVQTDPVQIISDIRIILQPLERGV